MKTANIIVKTGGEIVEFSKIFEHNSGQMGVAEKLQTKVLHATEQQ